LKIAVVGGAGAMGGVWASQLGTAGHDVAILDVAKEALAVIDRDGLTVEQPDGTERVFRLAATDRADEIGVCDAIVVFMKAHQTRSAAELARPTVDPRTTVATLQNGWGNAETLAEAFDPNQIAMGVTYHSATLLGPGRVAHTASDRLTYLGPYFDGAPLDRARAVGEAMTGAGIPTTVTADVATEIWKKLILNAAGLPVAALTRLTSGAMGATESVLEVCDGLTREAVAVAQARGLAIDGGERIAAIRNLLATGGRGKPSMLQDVEARRKTEIEVVNGAIVREAAIHGIDVPLNRTMLALVKGLEASWQP
jgi:2-dehydropantoate 2-reductase